MGKYKVLDIFSFLPANVISLEQLEKVLPKEVAANLFNVLKKDT